MDSIQHKAERALDKAAALGDEVHRVFVQLDRDRILADAAALDAVSDQQNTLPLYGLLVSLKDLFDEAGQVSSAASRVLQNKAAADEDAPVVARLKAAGALVFGRTSMTEFAYSGIGQNPHYGTPGCIFDRSLIPGGSSSGAALSVAHGLCDLAMGTDTGGSVRLPAAINGLYGFKPSAQSIPIQGVHPLSSHYDSVGPLAASLQTTLACLNVIRDEPLQLSPRAGTLTFGVPKDVFVADLDNGIATAFEHQLQQLQAAGHTLKDVSLGELDGWTDALRLTVSYEARAYYKDYLSALKTQGDKHVLSRIHQSDGMTDSDLTDCLQRRQAAIAYFNNALEGVDALLAPTMKCERPTIAQAMEDFDTWNPAVLRNTTYINLVDGCALTIPVARHTGFPTGLMICGPNGADNRVLAAGKVIDQCLNH